MSEEDFHKQSTHHAGGPPMPTAAPLPKQIGPYKIESMLDKGGASVLYLGIHPETHEPLTIKVLSPQFLSQPEMIDRFLKESKIIAMTSHPNIVRLFGEGQWEGGLYIAMEFIQGISLRQLILQNTLSTRRALEIVIQIAYAIAHLHTHGVIHRDLKPENILLTATGGIKVVDFGIAQLHHEALPLNEKKRLIGTPVYMSPEQKSNPQNVTFQADIYALGIITYELVLGKLSHGSIHLSLMPHGLQKILAKALKPNPAERYPDIVDFITDLSAYLKSEELEREVRGRDLASHLTEELQAAATLFAPVEPPSWPRVDFSLAHNSVGSLPSQYIDYFNLENGRYALIVAESQEKSAKGMISLALLKGMVRGLETHSRNLKELLQKIDQLLLKDREASSFSVAFLLLDPVKNQLHYLCCGDTPLWLLASGSATPRSLSGRNKMLGEEGSSELIELQANWQVGDSLVLSAFTPDDDEAFEKTLQEVFFLPPAKQSDLLLRKIAPQNSVGLFDKPHSVIAIHRLT